MTVPPPQRFCSVLSNGPSRTLQLSRLQRWDWREFGVDVGEDTVGRYLRAWGFSPQKPMRRAYEQADETLRQWLEERYPQIVNRAYRECAEILWADESGLRSDHTAGRTWAPVGQTLVTKGTGQRCKANMIAAILTPAVCASASLTDASPARCSWTSSSGSSRTPSAAKSC